MRATCGEVMRVQAAEKRLGPLKRVAHPDRTPRRRHRVPDLRGKRLVPQELVGPDETPRDDALAAVEQHAQEFARVADQAQGEFRVLRAGPVKRLGQAADGRREVHHPEFARLHAVWRQWRRRRVDVEGGVELEGDDLANILLSHDRHLAGDHGGLDVAFHGRLCGKAVSVPEPASQILTDKVPEGTEPGDAGPLRGVRMRHKEPALKNFHKKPRFDETAPIGLAEVRRANNPVVFYSFECFECPREFFILVRHWAWNGSARKV